MHTTESATLDNTRPKHPPDLQADAQLALRLRRREHAAIEELSSKFGAPLTRAAWVYLGDSHAAADVVQETLIAAWDGVKGLKNPESLRPWLFGVMFNRCRKHVRAIGRRRKRELDIGQRPAQTSEPVELDSVQLALHKLDEESRQVVVLRYMEEMDVGETAKALSIPEGTVKSRTHSALKKMKELMEREDV